MESEEYRFAINAIQKMSAYEMHRVQDFITNIFLEAEDGYVEETRFADGIECPHCGAKGKGVTRNGKAPNGKPRFRCSHCGKTFSATTNRVTYHSKKTFSVWKKYIACFINGDTVKVAAAECGINPKTAWRWRIKICDSLQIIMEQVKIEGVAEADETYFPVSFKGHRRTKDGKSTMPCKAKKRGWSCERDVEDANERYKRGLSEWQVCVACVVSTNGMSVAKVTGVGTGSYAGIDAAIGDHIVKGSVLCTDGGRAYARIARERGFERVKVEPKHHVKGVYGIQHINNYHARMKHFMMIHEGVCTKHLNSYLVWFNFARYAKEQGGEKMRILMEHIVKAKCWTRVVDISNRPDIPYINERVRRASFDRRVA